MADFLALSNVKAALRIPTAVTTHDTAITAWIVPAEQAVYNLLGVAGLTQTTYSEVLDVREPGVDWVKPLNWPVISVAALTNDGSAVDADDYYVEPRARRAIKLTGDTAYFAEGKQTVEITYSAGYAGGVPARFVQAAALIAADLFTRAADPSMTTERSGDYTRSVSTSPVPPAALALLMGDVPLMG